MTVTDDTASTITEALERAASLHEELLKRVRELLEDEEPIQSSALTPPPPPSTYAP